VWGVLTTAQSVTPVGGLAAPLVAFSLLYVLLGIVTAVLLRRQIAAHAADAPAGAGPGGGPRAGGGAP
jgi:hypothetical protein